jgi:hypothetical protein
MLYDIFSGEDLKIAEKIQQRRLQMLVHSYIYYELDTNIVSDSKWSEWAVELRNLQKSYPEIENKVPYRLGFENWDGSTGAFLPYKDDQIQSIAMRLLPKHSQQSKIILPKTNKSMAKNFFRKKLF